MWLADRGGDSNYCYFCGTIFQTHRQHISTSKASRSSEREVKTIFKVLVIDKQDFTLFKKENTENLANYVCSLRKQSNSPSERYIWCTGTDIPISLD